MLSQGQILKILCLLVTVLISLTSTIVTVCASAIVEHQQEVLPDGSTAVVQEEKGKETLGSSNNDTDTDTVVTSTSTDDVENYDNVEEYNRKKNEKATSSRVYVQFNGTIPNVPEVEADGKVYIEYGKPQTIIIQSNTTQTKLCNTVLHTMHQYMYGTIYMTAYNISNQLLNNNNNNDNNDDSNKIRTKQKQYSKMQTQCQLREESCIFWSAIGECEVNPAYMKIHCAPACGTCEQLLFETRCPMDDNITENNCWKNTNGGDLHSMFTRITTDPYYKNTYGPITIISQPGIKPSKSVTNGQQMYNDSPWIITIDDFITEDECSTLIELGRDEGYKRSEDVGTELFDGTYSAVRSHSRTSTNAWCNTNNCYNNSITQTVLQKIVNLTNIHDNNSEYLQLLNYTIGQFYKQHHDLIGHHINRQSGVRILTVFLYLNTVTKGGGTQFPYLNLTVMPRRGRVLIWPSVLDSSGYSTDDIRTTHEALPVEDGIKYGANAWIHLRDFKTPYSTGCT